MQRDPNQTEIDLAIIRTVMVVAVCASIAYLVYFGVYLKLPLGLAAEWGQFGDFLGGVVNPVVGVATVILVARTLQTTRQEARDTRNEMAEQTASLKRELEVTETQYRLAVIAKRLDGVLDDWRSEMQLPVGNLPMLRSEDPRKYMEHRALLNASEFLRRVDVEKDFHNVSGKENLPYFWSRRFGNCLHLLNEMDQYMREYESSGGEKAVTDFYRRRVQEPLKVFSAVGILFKDDLAKFGVQVKHRVFGKFEE